MNNQLWEEASEHMRDLATKALWVIIGAVQKDFVSYPADERTACALVACSCSLAVSPTSGPRQLEIVSRLSALAALCGQEHPSVQLQLARLVLALRAACFHEAAVWGSSRLAGGLLLSDCMMRQLEVTAQCPSLSQLLIPIETLERSIRYDS